MNVKNEGVNGGYNTFARRTGFNRENIIMHALQIDFRSLDSKWDLANLSCGKNSHALSYLKLI